jgi:hypothetical protein
MLVRRYERIGLIDLAVDRGPVQVFLPYLAL